MGKRTLKEELERFNNIGSYVEGLSEQMGSLKSVGSGFTDKQMNSRRAQEFMEQDEDEMELDLGDEELEDGDDEMDLDLDGDEMDLDLDDDMELDMEEPSEDSEEIDVTDLVTMSKDAEEKAGEAKESLDAQSDKIASLVSKMDDLTNKLDSIDTITQSIEDLEQKIEDSKPPTPIEKLELRSLDSGPFSEKPLEFWDRKKEEMDDRGYEKEYILTQDEADEFNDKDIQASFDKPTPEQEEDEEDEFNVLGNGPNM